jgi:hypothetical protein
MSCVFDHVCSLGAQLREHRIQIADPEVEHGLLGAGPEVAGLGLERREDRQPGFLTPQAVLIGVQAQAIAVPRAQGRRTAARMKYPPIPLTRSMPLSCQDDDRGWHHTMARFTPRPNHGNSLDLEDDLAEEVAGDHGLETVAGLTQREDPVDQGPRAGLLAEPGQAA